MNLETILMVIGIAVIVIAVGVMVMRAKKIDKEGTETTAVISRIEITSGPDPADPDSYINYVQFQGDDGQIHEGRMSLTQTIEFEVGEEVRIKYIPGKYNMVRQVKE